MWKSKDVEFLIANVANLTTKEIAESIGKTERAVKLYMYRNNISGRRKLTCPLIERMLIIKFGSPKYFSPDRSWFEKVGIGQKRFSDLKKGYVQPTEDELKKIAKGINLNVDEMCEFFRSRRLELFD